MTETIGQAGIHLADSTDYMTGNGKVILSLLESGAGASMIGGGTVDECLTALGCFQIADSSDLYSGNGRVIKKSLPGETLYTADAFTPAMSKDITEAEFVTRDAAGEAGFQSTFPATAFGLEGPTGYIQMIRTAYSS